MKLGAFELKASLPKLREPHALAMLRPWVDVGSVGSLTLAKLESHLGAKELGRLSRPGSFYDFTRYRPTVYFQEGLRQITIPNSYITYARAKGGQDFLLFHLLEPHLNGEDFVESVMKVMDKFQVKRYCLLGSMYDMVVHTRPLPVTGIATGSIEEEVRKLGTRPSSYEGPTTIVLRVTQEAMQQGMEVVTLIVHLPQYIQLEEDYAGQLRLLRFLNQIYGLSLTLDELEHRAEEQSRQISRAVERDPTLAELVRRLERYHEAQEKEKQKGQEAPHLSPEVEQFLREIDKRFDSPQG